MATIKGVWIFNETIDILSVPEGRNSKWVVDFILPNKNNFACNGMYRYDSMDGIANVLAYTYGDVGTLASYADANDMDASKGWQTSCQTIEITSEPTDEAFITWLTANATQQKSNPTLTFDLASLGLGEGTHSIFVKLNGEGWSESDASNTVQYTVEPQGVTLAAGTYVGVDKIPSLSGTILTQSIQFISNGNQYDSIKVGEGYPDSLLYHKVGDEYYHEVYNGMDGWGSTAYKTIILDTDQTVTAEFGAWFINNFVYTSSITSGVYAIKRSDAQIYLKSSDTNGGYELIQDASHTSVPLNELENLFKITYRSDYDDYVIRSMLDDNVLVVPSYDEYSAILEYSSLSDSQLSSDYTWNITDVDTGQYVIYADFGAETLYMRSINTTDGVYIDLTENYSKTGTKWTFIPVIQN